MAANGDATALVEQRPILQVVDKDAKFRETFREDLKAWNFDTKGFDYFVVAVLGVQSSGKSTLLNLLFGTDFQVMNANEGRSQTTLGVWLGLSGTTEQNILVFDVEGTDSRERGDDHAIFERKLSLFSLALSEILIINMWTQDVGRFEGANYSLLKIVFEMNLRLFRNGGQKNKTLIYFIFRDHIAEETPLEKIAATIRSDMDKIWKDMPKPDQFTSSVIADFFDFRFTGLPHKKYQPASFAEGVAGLREQFLDKSLDNYILDKKYKTDVPADGFAHYAQTIWETIQEEKDLNLPSQKQMLAMFRCDEIAKEACAIFDDECNEKWAEPINSGTIVKTFGTEASAALKKAIAKYDEDSKRYDVSVQASRREDMVQRINQTLVVLFHSQLKLILHQQKDKFLKTLKQSLPESEPLRTFMTLARELEQEAMTAFEDAVRFSIVEDFASSWTYTAEVADLQHYIKTKINDERDSQLKRFSEGVKKQTERELAAKMSKVFDKASDDMWTHLRKVYEGVSAKSRSELSAILKDFECDESEITDRMKQQDRHSFAALKTIMDERAKSLDTLMGKTFRDAFELDADGVPRQWTAKDDIKALWTASCLASEKLVDLFAIIRLDEADEKVQFFHVPDGSSAVETVDEPRAVSDDKVVITQQEGTRLLERFRETAKAPYFAAIKEQERVKSQRSIPVYFLIITFLLGFNELMWVIDKILFSPVMLVFVAFFAAVAFGIWKLNLWPLIEPVLVPMLKTGFESIQEKAHDLLHGQQQHMTIPSTPSGIKKDDKGKGKEKEKPKSE